MTFGNEFSDLQKRLQERQDRYRARQASLTPEERARKNREALEARSYEIIAAKKAKGIPARYLFETFDTWIAETEAMKTAKVTVMNSAWQKNLLMSGKNGTGKTHLAYALVADGAYYTKFSVLCAKAQENYKRAYELYRDFAKNPLLIIDEVCRRDMTDFAREVLFEVLDERYNRKLPTTIITNASEKEFCDICNTAILDRFRYVLAEFNWESYRSEK